ncbi:MAG: helix-turn-helix transcriptional regulator [Pseudomonadota bacterium]
MTATKSEESGISSSDGDGDGDADSKSGSARKSGSDRVLISEVLRAATSWLAVARIGTMQPSFGVDERAKIRNVAKILETALALALRNAKISEPGRSDSTLDPTDRRILALIASGSTYWEIGRRLGICYGTVHSRIKALYKRFGVHSKIALVELLRDLWEGTPPAPAESGGPGSSVPAPTGDGSSPSASVAVAGDDNRQHQGQDRRRHKGAVTRSDPAASSGQPADLHSVDASRAGLETSAPSRVEERAAQESDGDPRSAGAPSEQP